MVWVCIGTFQQIPWFSNNTSNINNLQIQQFQNETCQIWLHTGMGKARSNSRVTHMCPQLYDFIMPSMTGQKNMQYYNFHIQQQWTRSVELKQLGVTCIIMHLLVAQHTWRINAWTALVSPGCCYLVTVSHNLAIKLYILKDIGRTNEATPKPACLVIHPCCPSVHRFGHPCGWTPWKLQGYQLHTIPLLDNHPSTESDTAAFCPPRMGRK